MSNYFDNFTFGQDDSRVYFKDSEFSGRLLSAKEIETSFTDDNGNAVKQMEYLFECIDGKKRTLRSGSKRLFQAMKKANAKAGDFLKINKLGEGMQTQFFVKVIESVSEEQPSENESLF